MAVTLPITASRRGAALLIVLATIIVTMTAVTILVQSTSTLQFQQHMKRCEAAANDLLNATDGPIKRWVQEDSAKAIAPADNAAPRFAVLDDHLALDSLDCELIITAFDQCGMVPLESVRGGSPLRLTLPAEILRMVDASSLPKGVAGLDWLVRTDDDAVRGHVFPAERPGTPALGELVATHNGPPEPGAGAGPGAGAIRININTAPMPLVEAALRLVGRGGLEQIVAARKVGKPATAGSQVAPVNADAEFVPQIVSSSTCWSFRIDIHIGPLWRSWWAVYQPGVSSSRGGGGGWECVQRLAITE